MSELYPEIRTVHILAVVVSGTLFALRGAASVAGTRRLMSAPVRYLAHTVDTVLLGAALMLVAILPEEAFANHWLTLKVALVILYIVLGFHALRRERSQRARAVCYVLALLAFAWVVGIARAHDPLGWLTLVTR